MWRKSSSFTFVAKNVWIESYAQKRKSTNCRECFHSTLRWKGKYQQNWKESSELKIAPKTKNQYSCRRGCQNDNLACGKVNLASKWRKLQEKSFELNIAPKTKNQYSCRRGWDCLNFACGKVNLASKWRKLQENVILSNIFVKGKKFIRYLYTD